MKCAGINILIKTLIVLIAGACVSLSAQEILENKTNCKHVENEVSRIDCFKEALAKKHVQKDTLLYLELESELAVIYRKNRNIFELAQQLDRISGWFKKSTNPEILYRYYLMSGAYHKTILNDSLALDFYQKCIPLVPELPDDPGRCFATNNLGVFYYGMGYLEEAMHYYVLSLECREKYKDTLGMARLHKNIGNLYLRGYKDADERAVDKGKEHWDRAITLYEAVHDTTAGIIDLYFNYAYSSFLPDLRERIRILDKGITIAEQSNNADFLIDAYELRGRLLAELFDYKGAYESMVKRNVYQQEAIYGINNQLVEQARVIQESSPKTEKWITGIPCSLTNAFSLLVILIGVGAIIFINIRKRKKAKQDNLQSHYYGKE